MCVVLILSQPFRLWLGVTEYLFRQPQLLDEVLKTAIEDNTFRADDIEFTFAARVSTGASADTLLNFTLSFDAYC